MMKTPCSVGQSNATDNSKQGLKPPLNSEHLKPRTEHLNLK